MRGARNSGGVSGSVGIVETRLVDIALPAGGVVLERGGVLKSLQVAYECYGEISEARDNVIFICHALSGDAHVAGFHGAEGEKPGWWDEMIGPGKGIDTRYYHVVCANVLGGCRGTTGPSSINPDTGRAYGSDFPHITVGDIVDVHRQLLLNLGISRLAAVAGGSFGGMQALEWAIRYPEMIERCICIASAFSLSAQALAFDVVGRNAITSDPDWWNGNYYGTGRQPSKGLSLARKIGHITYLSQEMMEIKFGRGRQSGEAPHEQLSRETRFVSDFQVESYLEYQGRKFLERFDANSYLQITRAMDEYDLSERYGGIDGAMDRIAARTLVVALSSDWLFPPEQSVEMAGAMLKAAKRVSYCELEAPHGHDAFLVDIKHLAEVISSFLPWVGQETGGVEGSVPAAEVDITAAKERVFEVMLGMISTGASVLDVGCGGGDFLAMLKNGLGIDGLGIDIDLDHVITTIDKGHDVLHSDLDAGLAVIPDASYDFAVLSETLQAVKSPLFVLREMLRVARTVVIGFPNIGKWTRRARLALSGRMPSGGPDPSYKWYNTPNIHMFTLADFQDLCLKENIRILETRCISDGIFGSGLIGLGFANAGADIVVLKLERGKPAEA